MGKILLYLKTFRYDLIVLLMAFRNPRTPGFLKGAMVAALLYLVTWLGFSPQGGLWPEHLSLRGWASWRRSPSEPGAMWCWSPCGRCPSGWSVRRERP